MPLGADTNVRQILSTCLSSNFDYGNLFVEDLTARHEKKGLDRPLVDVEMVETIFYLI